MWVQAPEQDQKASWAHFPSPFADLGDQVQKPGLSFLTLLATSCGPD